LQFRMYKNKTTARCVGLYASISLAYSTRIRWIMDHGSKVTAAFGSKSKYRAEHTAARSPRTNDNQMRSVVRRLLSNGIYAALQSRLRGSTEQWVWEGAVSDGEGGTQCRPSSICVSIM